MGQKRHFLRGEEMIDIHCHILPEADDGAKSLDESIEMATAAVKEGIHTIIATPHHKNGKYENTKMSIIQQVSSLNDKLQKANIPLVIVPGQETRIYGEILDGLASGEILTLNETQYLFIEFPSNHVPHYTERLFFDIQLQGIIPIIVHPERNQELIERPEILYNLVRKGALTQITAASITGHFGKKIKKFSHQLVEANLTHFVSSDAHNLTSRSFKMNEAIDCLESQYGMDMVYMFSDNAELLLAGKNVNRDEPMRIKHKKFLGIF